MKKILSAAILLALVISCKKTKTNTFTASDTTGSSVVKGSVNKNVITANSSGGWTSNTRVPAQGVNVSVTVAKSSLYANANAQGADVYSGVTDANGNYAISVKSNASGVNAQVTIDGFTTTLDTVVNGTTKKGFLANFAGTSQTLNVVIGQNVELNHSFTGQYVATNPNNNLNIGNATVTGSVGINYIKEVSTGTLITLTTTNVPLPGHTVYLNLSNDPNTLSTKMYTATTNANGYYSFNLTTVAAASPGFPQNAVIWIADYASTRDTLKLNQTIKTGRPGVFQMQTQTENNIFNNNIRNANHFVYLSFIPD